MIDDARLQKAYASARQMVGIAEFEHTRDSLKRAKAASEACPCDGCKIALDAMRQAVETVLWMFENAGEIIGAKALEHLGREMRHYQNGQSTPSSGS